MARSLAEAPLEGKGRCFFVVTELAAESALNAGRDWIGSFVFRFPSVFLGGHSVFPGNERSVGGAWESKLPNYSQIDSSGK